MSPPFGGGAGGLRRQLPRPPTLRDGQVAWKGIFYSRTRLSERVMHHLLPAESRGFEGVLGTRSLAPRNRASRWRGAAVDLIPRSVESGAGLRPSPFFGCCPSEFMARHQGHKPLAALRGQPGKFCVRRCAYFRTNNWPACPTGCCSLVLGPLHFISPATKKTRGRDKARGWFRDPLTHERMPP